MLKTRVPTQVYCPPTSCYPCDPVTSRQQASSLSSHLGVPGSVRPTCRAHLSLHRIPVMCAAWGSQKQMLSPYGHLAIPTTY